MNLEEKAGMMFINGAPVSEDGLPDGKIGLKGPVARMPSVADNMKERNMVHFNIWGIPDDPQIFAGWYNRVQLLAEKNRHTYYYRLRPQDTISVKTLRVINTSW